MVQSLLVKIKPRRFELDFNTGAGFGLAMFLFTFVAYRHIDSRGRRFLLLISLGGMAVSLAVVSSLFYIPDPKVRRGLVASVSIAIFTFFYSLGGGPIPFTLSPEVFPLCVRGAYMTNPPATT